MADYKGLTGRFEVEPGPRTPASEHVPWVQSLMSSGSKRVEVRGEMVYPFSAQKCFDMMKDYRKFLLTHLKGNEQIATAALGKQFHARPLYVTDANKFKNGSVGSMVQYAFFSLGVVYWMVDKVTTLDDGEQRDGTPGNNKVFRFAMETQSDMSTPKFPLVDHGTFMIFTTYANDPNQCHLAWIRKFHQTKALGCISTTDQVKAVFDGDMQRDLNTFWVLLHSTYASVLPKKDSRVLVIGAGPSGLHMTYELIQRGLSEENVTILEKDERYGGKTLSIESKSNVMLNQPIYNPPPPKAAVIPQIKAIVQQYYTCKTIREAITAWISGGLTPAELAAIERKNTPNALHAQDNYFTGGEKIYHELGTCYLSPGYYAIRTLLKRIQKQVELKSEMEGNEDGIFTDLAKADMTREVGPDTYAIESSAWEGAKTLPQWIEYSGKSVAPLAPYCSCNPATENLAVNASVMAAKLQYCKIHEQLLGNYQYTLPPQPSDENFEKLITPFSQFLKDNNLLTMEPLFTYALTAQGYGIIQSTPTFLAMQWLTPDLLDGYFEWYYYFMLYKDAVGNLEKPIPKELQKFNNFRKGMLVSGWGGLWDRIVSLYDLKSRIKFSTDVKRITRKGGKIQVSYVHKNREINEEYDFLIVGAPLSDPAVDPTVPTLPLDFDSVEKDLFLSKGLAASKFKTTLFKPEKNGNYEADHLRIFIDAILNTEKPETVGTGEVFGSRDSYKAIQPRLSTLGGDKYDPTKDMPREKMCYQYVSPEKLKEYGSDEHLFEAFKKWMLDHPDYFKDSTGDKDARIQKMFIQAKAWTYYTHYEADDLLSGKLWKILEIQGKKNTIFVHASTNFESVLDIVNYNYMLLDGMAGRLDSLLPPVTDTRPTPGQRPQVLLFNRSVVHNVIRAMLNFFIFIVWSIWYMISYPLAEGFYLRFQRYNLQKAYKTQNLGSPWGYNMSKFNNVSPTLVGYLDWAAGKSNGLPEKMPEDYDPYKWDAATGPGDTVFKILQAPKNHFLEKHPEIPNYHQIPASFMWNLTDMRVAIRFWLTTFEDTFQPLLTPTFQKIIQTFSYYVPNYYSWIFSWIFASQFRLLIGFSYRFEDKFGGGLRIPDCNMLRTAVKDHGMEIGQRVCLTICKIFTEETMKKKRFKIDFQPDFLSGSGFGCKVRMDNPVINAYSNHSLWKMRTNEEQKQFEDIDVSW